MAQPHDSTNGQEAGRQAVADLQEMLKLTPLGRQQGEEIYSALTINPESRRIFGGQVLAQAIVALSDSVVETRTMHSIHAYFLRPGQVDQDLSFGVQKLTDARSFTSRRVQAYQQNQVIFSAIASFQEQAQGPNHSTPAPQNMPKPEELASVAETVGHLDLPIAQAISYHRPFDLRYIQAPLWLKPDPNPPPNAAVWFKTFAPLPDDPLLHRAALAYASDYLPVEPGLRAHGKFWLQQGLKVASLDHAIWFHRPARADQWLLYTLESPSAQDARSLALGKIFSSEGEHVATVAQETMLRLPEYRS